MNTNQARLLPLFFCLATNVLFGADNQESFTGATVTRPAKRWEEGFLSGNGNLGVLIFGEPYAETVVLNHCKLYLPRGSNEIVQDLAESMPEFKAAGLKAGIDGPAVVHKMMLEKSGQKIIHTDPFHPACLLKLEMPGQSDAPRNYRMTGNFRTGELVVRWSDSQGDWQRKLFVSRPDNVVVMAIDGPEGKVGCRLSMEITHDLVKPTIASDGHSLSAHVVYAKGKGGYDCLIRVIPDGGTTQGENGRLSVSGADRVLLLMQVRTWKTPIPKEQSEAWAYSPEHPDFGPNHKTNLLPDMNTALAQLQADYDSLFAPHARVHGDLFSRVKLDLQGGADRSATSEELLERAAETKQMPLALMERMYDACRYLAICSTGERPANLQGIWTGTWKPAWSGDYTLDSNLQLEVQSLMSCNMPELMQPYFDLVESWLPDCRLNAKKLYGCRGVVSNPRSSNNCLLLHWGRWPGEQAISCLGWLAHFFYDYYQFTGDKTFLAERTVPLMKELALYYEDLLVGTEDENGKYRFFISYSPEQRLIANATIDIAVAKGILNYLIQSCETLSIEQDNLPKWKTMVAKMPPYLVNESGDFQEWSWPGAPENYNHRHHSHFLPLYQFCEIDRDRTPDLWKASGIAFQRKVDGWLNEPKKSANSGHITHGMVNQGQCATRLGRSDIVYEVLSRMATDRYIYPGFMFSYWQNRKGFGFDAPGTIPDVVNNSLLFAWDGVLDLIPALPEQWPKGSISGVLARGQIQVNRLAWDQTAGQVDLTLTSQIAQTIIVRMPPATQIESIKTSGGKAMAEELPGKPDCRRLSLPAGMACKIDISFEP